ncbi:MAG: sugar isomerase domain-containing protein [Angelakisella sp.]
MTDDDWKDVTDMYMDSYFEKMRAVLQTIETTQRESLIAAGKAIADSLAEGGMLQLLDTGHMLMHEGVGRTGGLMALRPIKIDCEISNPTRYRKIEGKQNIYYDMVDGFPAFVLAKANLTKGDILIIGSVSGYNILPVELALAAKRMGVTTIAITSVTYSKELTSKHPSGKRLFEACDYVLDNCGEFGDAMVPVEELEGKKICPSSGIGASYLLWALECCIVEELVKKGIEPSIYISNHMPNASAINGNSMNNYEKYGY